MFIGLHSHCSESNCWLSMGKSWCGVFQFTVHMGKLSAVENNTVSMTGIVLPLGLIWSFFVQDIYQIYKMLTVKKNGRFNYTSPCHTLVLVNEYHAIAHLFQIVPLVPYCPSRTLRSQDAGLLVISRISKSRMGSRAFSYLAPLLWNHPSVLVWQADTLFWL